MRLSLEARFERYCDTMVATMQHADRQQPGRWYLKGLVLPGGRKSMTRSLYQPPGIQPSCGRLNSLVFDVHKGATIIARHVAWYQTLTTEEPR